MNTIPHRQVSSPVKASFAQQRMWFLEQLDQNNAIYNQLNALMLKGPLDVDMLSRSLNLVISRHEALRTNLSMDNGQVLQRISAPKTLEIPLVDMSGLTPEKAMEEAERLAVLEAKKPFDLEKEPLVRARLFELPAGEYLLSFVTHHAIFDGWSINILINELAVIYEAICHGSPMPLIPPIQYTDYALWQQEMYELGKLDVQLNYWLDKLVGELPLLELPIDHVRPPVQSFEGEVHTRYIPPDLGDSLKIFAKGERSTLFMVLLASYYVFLYRYTSQADIVIGCPIAGRRWRETEDLIGLFVNTLPMRVHLSGEETFRDLVRRVRKSALEAYDHQDIPFDKLVEKLPLDRQPSRTPVFQTIFQMRNFPDRQKTRSDIDIERHYFNYTTAKVDLTLEITETSSGLSCRFVYPTALFDESTIVAMAEHWETLLSGIVDNPDMPIARLPILAPQEIRRIIQEWNETRTVYPRDSTVHSLFEGQAGSNGDRIAIIHRGEQMTYRQLNSRANKLARYLNVTPGTLVAVYMERSIDLVVCELAILKAGGVYVPIDPSDPPERTLFMLGDTHAGIMLAKSMPEFEVPRPCRVICLDDEREAIDCQDDRDLPGSTGAGDIAYIMYTSGTTGQPKGVRVPHRAIARLVLNTNYVRLGHGDTVAHVSNPAFDASTFEVWGALLNGARLRIFDRETVISPAGFADAIDKEDVTAMFLTGQLFSLLARSVPGAFKRLKYLLVGGEAVDPGPARLVLAHGPPEKLIDAYGPTENTTFGICHEIREVPAEGPLLIGRPISNTTAYILDGSLQPVPIGVTGEIFLGGDGVALGYHERPDLTQAAFIADPFNPGAKLYRTGDLACYRPDGNIKFLGRRDRQVKIRGYRVETDEIKTVIETYPPVRGAIVTVKDLGGEKRLMAYVMTSDGMIDADDLRVFLRKKLPEYMMPANIIPVKEFPLTPTGKIDYGALAAGEETRNNVKGTDEPFDALEKELSDIWKEVLGIDHIGITDNFFDLGGHSLSAASLCSKIGEKFGMSFPLNIIFLSPTVRLMADIVREKTEKRTLGSLLELRPGTSGPPLFCLHNVAGGLLEYEWLKRMLRQGRWIYGLQPPQDGTLGRSSIEEMAAYYVKEIEAVWPAGPYYLLGYCFGGAIAFEMARQLKEKGKEVGFLGLIEYRPPAYRYALDIRSLKMALSRARVIISNIMHAPGGQRIKRTVGIPATLWEFAAKSLRPTVALPGSTKPLVEIEYPDWITCQPETYRETCMWDYRAVKEYVPKGYDGKVTLFISLGTNEEFERDILYDRRMGWEKYIKGPIETIFTPGCHTSIMQKPNVDELALKIDQCLEKA